jgi:hypothetical protein
MSQSTNVTDLLNAIAQQDSTVVDPPSELLQPPDDEVSVLTEPSDITDMSTPKGQNKFRAALITIFPPDTDQKWLLPNTYFPDTSVLNIWCGQFEAATQTERLHAHIYMEFKNKFPMRFTKLKKLIKDVVGEHGNIKTPRKISKKSRGGAVNYVLKPCGRMTDTHEFIWPHNTIKVGFDQALWDQRVTKKASPKSKDDVVKEQIDHIESKPKHWTWDQIVHENMESKLLLATCSWGQKYHAGRHAETPRRQIANVIILYGAGGTGKTTFAHKWDVRDDEDFHERYYRRNPDDGAFWGGGRTAYKGQRIIHMEEFCGQEPFHRVKEICDIGKEGPSVNIKQSGIELNHDTVVFTSNHHPAAWYRHLWGKEAKQFHPFWRRITQVWFFPAHRPDGTLNVPDEGNPPHFVDQTDEWKALAGDYDACVKHADEYWPLPEPEPVGGTGSSSNTFNFGG